MIEQILILAILIILSGFFSSSELAFFSLNNLRIKHLVDKGTPGILTVKKLKERPRYLLNTILIGNNLVNIGASVYATMIAIDFFKSNIIGIVTGIMTAIILIFGEIIPKGFAMSHAEFIAIMFAKPLQIMMYIFYPITFILVHLSNIFGVHKVEKKPTVTEDEIKSYVRAGEESGEISEEEKEMIHRIFRFDDVNVDEVMTPRAEMVMLSVKDTVGKAVKKIMKSGYSRFPVYEGHRDKIIGFVSAWDVMKEIHKGKTRSRIEDIMKKVFLIPPTMKMDDLLKHFLKRKQHMAIVVDEYGGTDGLITLEDVLEEIVGEIIDERDSVEPEITKINGRSWKVLGRTDIDNFFDKFKVKRKKDDFDTVNGYLIDKLGRIPKEKEEIELKNYKIIIEEMAGNRIKEIKITKN